VTYFAEFSANIEYIAYEFDSAWVQSVSHDLSPRRSLPERAARRRYFWGLAGGFLRDLPIPLVLTWPVISVVSRASRASLSNCDGHCVEAIDPVGEEHPGNRGAEQAEDDSSGCARTLVEVLLGGIFGFDSS
jgi:hypothetical protein